MCGSEVKQRFPPRTEVLEPQAGAKSNGSLSEKSWPGAEETIIIPIVAGDPQKEVAAAQASAAVSAPQPKPKPKPQIVPPRPNLSAPKPFFTEVMPAIENRQHRRLVFVVPVLLIIFIILLVFAILVLPYIVAR
jgi:hypothetical protein